MWMERSKKILSGTRLCRFPGIFWKSIPGSPGPGKGMYGAAIFINVPNGAVKYITSHGKRRKHSMHPNISADLFLNERFYECTKKESFRKERLFWKITSGEIISDRQWDHRRKPDFRWKHRRRCCSTRFYCGDRMWGYGKSSIHWERKLRGRQRQREEVFSFCILPVKNVYRTPPWSPLRITITLEQEKFK